MGAICDDDRGVECRGDGSLHAALAVAFFVSYNLNMAILCSIRPGAPHLRAMVALSLATKVRWVRPAAQAIATMVAGELPTLGAFLEWADISNHNPSLTLTPTLTLTLTLGGPTSASS